jgi:hypothetical protein
MIYGLAAILVLVLTWKVWLHQTQYSAETFEDVIERAHPVCCGVIGKEKLSKQVNCLIWCIRNARLLISLASHVQPKTAEEMDSVSVIRREAWRVWTWAVIGLVLAFLHVPRVMYSEHLTKHYEILTQYASLLCISLRCNVAALEEALFV